MPIKDHNFSSNHIASIPQEGHLLIIHQGAIGDMVLTFPVIEKLSSRYHSIDILCQHQIGKLAQTLGLVHTTLPLESSAYATLFCHKSLTPNHRLKTIFTKYQAILVISLSNKLAQSLKKWTSTKIYHIFSRPEASQRIHVSNFLFKQLKKLELIDTQACLSQYELVTISGKHRQKGPGDRHPLLLIHPGSGSQRKNWALNRFLEIAYHFLNKGWQPAFIVGPADQMLQKRLQANPHCAFKIYRPQELTDLVALLSSAKGYIGNDSGVTHLAGYLGITGVAIFGPSDPRRWKPLGQCTRVLHGHEECMPCFEVRSDECHHRQCLSQITVDQVIKEFTAVSNAKTSVSDFRDIKASAIQAGCAA